MDKVRRGEIIVVDTATGKHYHYPKFLALANRTPTNDFIRDMEYTLPTIYENPIHGHRFILTIEGSPSAYFACFEYDVVQRRWVLEPVGYEAPLPTIHAAIQIVGKRIVANCDAIDRMKEGNDKSYEELEMMCKALGEDIDELSTETLERVSSLLGPDYFRKSRVD